MCFIFDSKPYKPHPVTIVDREGKLPISHQKKDFNLVNGRYHQNHTRRMEEEAEENERRTCKKYWETHKYDFIRGRSYDPEMEDEYQKQAALQSQVWGKSMQQRIPPTFNLSEGNCFNIITNKVRNEHGLEVTREIQDRGLNKRRWVEEEEMAKENGRKYQERKDNEGIQRISYDRWDATEARGYNIVSNIKGGLPFRPKVSKKPLSWEKIQRGSRIQTANPSSAPRRGRDLTGGGGHSTQRMPPPSMGTHHQEMSVGSGRMTERSGRSQIPKLNLETATSVQPQIRTGGLGKA